MVEVTLGTKNRRNFKTVMTENERRYILTELVVTEVKVLHASQLDEQLRNHRNNQIRKGSVWQVTCIDTQKHDCKSDYSIGYIQDILTAKGYSGTSDKGPSEIGTTSLQRTLVSTPC